MKLVLEMKDKNVEEPKPLQVAGVSLLVTPPIDDEYWVFRVKVSKTQAIVGFPKFMTIGIGFAEETDWNTNLPYTCDALQIYEHIKHNKGRGNIRMEDCIEAIRMIQNAVARLKVIQ